MDLVRLGPLYSTNYIPDKLIEGYSSLIWTERFQDHGEFELKTFDIERMAALLPEDSLVSHLETREVMMVETHEINMVGEEADAVPELVIRGRSATTMLEHRWIESSYQKKRRMRRKYTANGALGVLLVNSFDNTSGFDLTRGDKDSETPELNSYPWPVKDALPNVAITESVTTEGNSRWWLLEQGVLYPQFQKIMVDADLGIRCIRPVAPNPATVFTVKSALAERGEPVRTSNSNVTALRYDVYQGIDRSGSVKLSLLQGHIDKPTYLMSRKEHKTVVEVMTDKVTISDVYATGEASLSGWQRRIMGFDAGAPEIPPEPQKPKEPRSNATAAQRRAYREALDKWQDKWAIWDNKRDGIVAVFKEEQIAAAKRALKQARRVDMFSGDVSSLSPYIYKTHYDLGDTIMLHGEYGKKSKMVVSEYVRTEDENGDRGFPGLVAP